MSDWIAQWAGEEALRRLDDGTLSPDRVERIARANRRAAADPHRHPAPFNPKVIECAAGMLDRPGRGVVKVLDPLAGEGRVHRLEALGPWSTTGVEIEAEWAAKHPRTYCADARRMPFDWHAFGAVFTSPAYGNRLADAYLPELDANDRRTYACALNRPLSDGNGAALHWGEDYRELHEAVWAEVDRVLAPGGQFVLNVKDFYRQGERQPVTAWHLRTLERLGYEIEDLEVLPLMGDRSRRNVMRCPELVVALRKTWREQHHAAARRVLEAVS